MEIKNIAILGPRGNVGQAVISEFLKDPARFNITAISRPTSAYAPPAKSGIAIKSADFDSFQSLVDAFDGQDAIINCVSGSATQYDLSKVIIDAVIAANVKFYFANEFVGHITREQYGRMPEVAVGAKVRVRKYMEELGNSGKLNWTSLNGGPFFDMWLMKGPAGMDVKNRKARIYGTGDNKLCWTPLPTMAVAVVNMLKNPDVVLNRPIYICPLPGLTQNKILEAVEKVTGQKFEVEHVDVEKINKNARIALDRGEVGKAMKGLTISNQFYEGDSGNDFSALVENDVVGVKEMSVEDAVKMAIEIYGEDSQVVEGMFMVNACDI